VYIDDFVYFIEVFLSCALKKDNIVKINVENTNYLEPINKKILILSIDNRNIEYINLHKKSWQNYSNLHGYTYLFENKNCENFPMYFCKYKRLLELMNSKEYSNYDYFSWVDSDTFVDKRFINFKFESMLNQLNCDYDIFTSIFKVTKNINSYSFNCGFLMFKNSILTRTLLQECIKYIDLSKWKKNNKAKISCIYAGSCYEEAALFYCVKKMMKLHKLFKHVTLEGFCFNGVIKDNTMKNNKNLIIHDLGKHQDIFLKYS